MQRPDPDRRHGLVTARGGRRLSVGRTSSTDEHGKTQNGDAEQSDEPMDPHRFSFGGQGAIDGRPTLSPYVR
jgi:hypothetical protein